MANSKNHYQILDVPQNATPEEIKKAYRKKAMQLHPDKNKSADATSQFADLNEANEVLSNDLKRRQYDAELRFAAQSAPAPKTSTTEPKTTPAPKSTVRPTTVPKPAADTRTAYEQTPAPQKAARARTPFQYQPAYTPEATRKFKFMPEPAAKAKRNAAPAFFTMDNSTIVFAMLIQMEMMRQHQIFIMMLVHALMQSYMFNVTEPDTRSYVRFR